MTRRHHTPLLVAPLLLAGSAWAQQAIPEPESIRDQMPAVSLLPEGSTLKGVILPRYDEKQRLLAVLRAELLKIIDAETVDGTKVRIDLHRAEGGHRGSIDLAKAVLDQARQLLRASEDVLISSTDMAARGSGLVFSLENGRGFLLGPVVTRFYPPPPDTSMNTPVRRSSSPATPWVAALGTAACLPLIAAPAPLTDQQLAAIDQQVSSAAPAADQRAKATAAVTKAANEQSESADNDLDNFLQATGLTTLLAEPAAASPPTKPPEVPAKPGDTEVVCDGGMYFDTEAGVLVYLKNIRLRDSRFDLECSKELKIFLDRQEPNKAKPGKTTPGDKPAPEKPAAKSIVKLPGGEGEGDLFGGGEFGEIKQIVASGNVKATRKDKKGKMITASGETAIFDGKTGDVILRGGYPTIRQGGSSLVAQQPGLYIRLYQNGDVYAQPGRWKTVANNLGDAKPGNN